MAEILYRWNGTQWIPVTNVTRFEVGGSIGEWVDFITGINILNVGFVLTNIDKPA